MTTSGSDAAETMVRMALSGAEVSVKLTASAAKNVLAITIALAKSHKKIYGKTKLRKMLQETRDIRVFQMSAAQFKRFERHAKRYKILYASVRDKTGQGSAIDLTLLDMKTGKELDMGSPFDLFSEVSHPDYRGVTEEQYENRMLLQRVMIRNGFLPIDCEWWHFCLENEPYPDTYFNFPVSSAYLKR